MYSKPFQIYALLQALKRLRCKHIAACKISINFSSSSRYLAEVIAKACWWRRSSYRNFQILYLKHIFPWLDRAIFHHLGKESKEEYRYLKPVRTLQIYINNGCYLYKNTWNSSYIASSSMYAYLIKEVNEN